MAHANGTIIAFYGRDPASQIIRWATFGGPSHVGIMCHGRLWESTSMSHRPDLISGEKKSGVQCQKLEDRLVDYKGCRVLAYPLHPHLILNRRDSERLEEFLISIYSATYDLPNALLSATHLIKYFSNPDFKDIFCSSLVARALMILNRMNHANPDLYSPGGLIRKLNRDGGLDNVKVLQR